MRPIKVKEWAALLSFDPGGHVGWAVSTIAPIDLCSPRRSLFNSIQHFAAGEINGTVNACLDQMIELIEVWPDAALLTERFDVGRQIWFEPQPIMQNAVLSWVLDGSTRYLFTQGSDKMTGMPDDRLKRAGARFWTSGSDHARAATKHNLVFLKRARESGSLRGRAWPQHFDKTGRLLNG